MKEKEANKNQSKINYLRNKLHEEVKRYIVDVSWHYFVYKRYANQLWRMKIIVHFARLLATGIASSGLIALLFTDEAWLQLATTILSLIVFLINGISRDYNYQDLYKKASKDAVRLWQLRKDSLDLLYDITYYLSDIEENEKRFQQFIEEQRVIYEGLLPVPARLLRKVNKMYYQTDIIMEEWSKAEERIIPEELRSILLNENEFY